MATKNLGAVTAYAYARNHGYTGTEEEFEALMAALPQAVSDAQAAVTTVTGIGATATTVPYGSGASARYNSTTNEIEFDIPQGNGISSIDLTKTEGAVKTYTITFDNGSTTTFDVTDGEVTKEELERDYARTDGYYDEMTAGNAEQLIGSKYVEDEAVYSFRTTGGTADVSNREYLEKITGGTVAWNQLCDVKTSIPSVRGLEGWASTFERNEHGATVTTVRDYSSMGICMLTGVPYVSGHKYFVSARIDSASFTPSRVNFSGYDNWSELFGKYFTWAGNDTYSTIVNSSRDGADGNAQRVVIYVFGTETITTGSTFSFSNWNLIDLTQMFGSTIADYLYNLETTTSGAGVAWFKKYFPKDYYAYDTGSIQSVSVSAHKTTGFNQWDEEWEVGTILPATGQNHSSSAKIRSKNYIPVIPNIKYCISAQESKIVSQYLYYYDVNKNFISYTTISGVNEFVFTTPINVHYLRFIAEDVTYKHDICINLVHSGYRNGEYEPYKGHSYSMDSSLELRGIPTLTDTNELTFDGDIYQYDGTVKRKYGIVDLGTLTWYLHNTYANAFYTDGFALSKGNASIICTKYPSGEPFYNYANLSDKTIYSSATISRIAVKDTAYADAASFKAAMNGVYLVYELATPTTESAEPYTQVQVCDDWGTEEFVDAKVESGDRDVTLPVLASTRYPANLRDKLQHLPDLAESNGDYYIHQEDSEMELRDLSESAIGQDVEEIKTKVSGLESLMPKDSASGTIASFSDGQDIIPAESLKVNLEPIQDLHGYDKPWAGGAGKNLVPNKSPNVPVSYAGVTMTIDGNDFVFNGTSTGTGGRLVFMTESFSLKSGTYFISVSLSGSGDVYPVLHNANGNVVKQGAGVVTIAEDINAFIGFNVSGTIGTAFDLKVKCQLESGSTATSWTPYENICPISGHTEVNTQRTGKNLLDASMFKDQRAWNNGEIKLQPNTQYTVSSNCDGSIVYLYVMGVGQTPTPQAEVYQGHTISVTSDANGILRYQQRVPDLSAGSVSDYWYQLELGSTATDYEPYQGTAYTTSLGRTVYGGTLDVVSGELVVDRAMVDLGTLNYSYVSNGNYFFSPSLYGIKKLGRENILSSDFSISTLTFTDMPNGTMKGNVDAGGMYFKLTDYSDATAFKTAMNGVQLVYELATPQTYQLTPQEVTLLLGQNNIWADSGAVEVVYTADPKLYIDKKLEEIRALINN